MSKITVQSVRSLIPRQFHDQVNPAALNRLDTCDTDTFIVSTVKQIFQENLGLVSEHNLRFEDYIDGSIFVGFKYHGSSNTDAFIKTFPKRHQQALLNGEDTRVIVKLAQGYSKRKVVVSIMEQALSKMWIYNVDAYQQAIDTQVDLMNNACSEKVRCDAANSILTHLAKPRDIVNNNIVNFDMRSHAGLDDLRDSLTELAEKQLSLIQKGVSTKDVIDISIAKEVVNEDS
ncbi:MAG: hypothetical protein LC106_08030 [Burkholderiales bacterium]|nr:hypothetical protein [Burkholderiales bacterium]